MEKEEVGKITCEKEKNIKKKKNMFFMSKDFDLELNTKCLWSQSVLNT